MGTAEITKRAVDGLQLGKADVFLWDTEVRGFGLKLTPKGVKTYLYAYRMGGREAPKRRFTIGRHGSPWTPDIARKEAKRLAIMVAQGADPMLVDKGRREDAATLGFADYVERYVDTYLKEHWKDGGPLAVGVLRNHAKPAFAGLTVRQITRGRISDFLDSLAATPGLRRNAFAILRRLFRWAVNRGDIEASPMTEMEAPAAPASRDRVLDDVELAVIWTAAGMIGYPFGPMFRMLLLTGQRREEVAGLRWSELDRPTAMWTLPPERAKNKQPHLVPLTGLAVETLDAIAAIVGDERAGKGPKWPRTGLVFTTTGESAVSGYSKAKTRLDAKVGEMLIEQAGDGAPETLEAWRIHDLRRTLATGLQRLGVRFEVTEAVLNHVSGAKGGVAGIYQRHDWKEEKRDALEGWEKHLRDMLTAPLRNMRPEQ